MRRRGLAPAALLEFGSKPLRGCSITGSQSTKALRGTKRVCQACAVRFYDLARQPIVCPSCGAHYVPVAAAMIADAGTRAARFTDKTGWRGRSFARPGPEPDTPVEVAAPEDPSEEAPIPIANEDAVLEEETDETDMTGLLDHHEEEPKER
jgi:uncharacterized protein (TIGR02300 family)